MAEVGSGLMGSSFANCVLSDGDGISATTF